MKRRIALTIAGVLVVALVLAVIPLLSGWLSGGGRQAAVLNVEATPVRNVSGSYTGYVQLQGAYAGTLDQSLAATPMTLGNIDLALELAQAGGAVSGFVALDNTLVFTREHTIMVTPVGPPPLAGTPAPTPHALDIGPKVQGSFGEALLLTSERITTTLSGRPVGRQFSLRSTSVQQDGAKLEGEYRETLWGYSAQPSTLVGKFSLERPVFGAPATTATPTPPPASNAKLYLPVIRR